MSGSSSRRLIINADDFGRSHAINRAVAEAHGSGVLTTASLMVNGGAFDEAVEIARQHPRLGVGLHLALVCGRPTLDAAHIPGLISDTGEFSTHPARAGFAFYFRRNLRQQLADEIGAQIAKFRSTGLELDHVNGHLNMHLHPVVLDILTQVAPGCGLRFVRLTREPFWLNAWAERGRWGYRISHSVIFQLLGGFAARRLRKRGIRHADRVFGLLQDGHVTEDYVLRLLAKLPPGDSELYSHPSLDESRHEFEALVSSRVRQELETRRITRIRYQDL